MTDLSLKLDQIKRFSIITGHYGSGKTNITINMALKLRQKYPQKKITVVDLDIVNPYFRTADFIDILENNSIRVITPTFANTNLDTPILPAEINSVFDNSDGYVLIDVGGDDAGAIALGRYSKQILNEDYDMYYVINKRRYQTKDAETASGLLADIEYCARIKATKIINNTNLGTETTLDMVVDSTEFADEICKQLELPLSFTAIRNDIDAKAMQGYEFEPVEIYIKPFYK